MSHNDHLHPYKEFGDKLFKVLEQKGLKQTDLGDLLEIYVPSTISRWCTGARLPTIQQFIKICNVLQVTPDTLLPNEDYLHHFPGSRGTGRNHEVDMDYEVLESDGVKWLKAKNLSNNFSKVQREEIEQGIKFFEELIYGKASTDKLLPQRGKIQKILLALRLNVIKFQQPILLDTQREDRLKRLCENHGIHLLDCKVVKLPTVGDESSFIDETILGAELVAAAACEIMSEDIYAGATIGLGHGATLFRFAERQPMGVKSFAGTTFVTMMAERELGYTITNHPASEVAYLMKRCYPLSNTMHLPFVEPHRRELVTRTLLGEPGLELFDSEKRAVEIMRTFPELNVVFTTIISVPHLQEFYSWEDQPPRLVETLQANLKAEKLDESKAKAIFLGTLLDEDGNAVPFNHLMQAVFGIDIHTFKDISRQRNKLVYLLAAGNYKKQAVLLALRNRLVNSLIITSEIAQHIIDDLEQNSI
jgi:DNA-binding transcriptional regulator LsrR (DeoR family)/transcriptional regulator with XRE-family HTH domain